MCPCIRWCQCLSRTLSHPQTLWASCTSTMTTWLHSWLKLKPATSACALSVRTNALHTLHDPCVAELILQAIACLQQQSAMLRPHAAHCCRQSVCKLSLATILSRTKLCGPALEEVDDCRQTATSACPLCWSALEAVACMQALWMQRMEEAVSSSSATPSRILLHSSAAATTLLPSRRSDMPASRSLSGSISSAACTHAKAAPTSGLQRQNCCSSPRNVPV